MYEENDTVGIILLFMCFMVIGASWMYWVNQRDEYMSRVMDCMVEVTEPEYNRCASMVSEEHRRQANAGW